MSRQIILDTETTGIGHDKGHRIIEIGCVELIDRKYTGRTYHQYINPERLIDVEAIGVHGITDKFVSDKPLFKEIFGGFLAFIKDSELVIHNAPFDIGFMNMEFARVNQVPTEQNCRVLDTLALARNMHPGQRNSLDALCRRYGIDNGHRTLHGALLDAEILGDVYLLMTGGQTDLMLSTDESFTRQEDGSIIKKDYSSLNVLLASDDELNSHDRYIEMMKTHSDDVMYTQQKKSKCE
jgi:DNA polymerase-3 subunit epsilon